MFARMPVLVAADIALMRAQPQSWRGFMVALALSLSVHAALFAPSWRQAKSPPPELPLQVRLIPPEVKPPASKPRQARPPAKRVQPQIVSEAPPLTEPVKTPASLPAPPAPTAEEWQLAASYTLRNSKRYRYTWAQQVRSMMGTAVEGPDQGVVRLRIEIAPDGTLAKVEELWSTSKLASALALQAIQNMPPLPPTPTGKPLIFEQTISFLPYETGWSPSYQLDCLPEPQSFENPFAWDGTSAVKVVQREHRPPPPEGCPPDSTEATIEEEERSFNRQMDQWRWAR